MKVVWIVNVAVADAAEVLNGKKTQSVTWIDGMLSHIKKEAEIVLCCPMPNSDILMSGEKDGVRYYGLPRKHKRGDKYEKNMSSFFGQVFENEKPDIVHIWGTEFPHTLSAVEAAEQCGILDHTVISIQGLVSIYAKHFMSTLPFWVQYLMVPKNFIMGFNLRMTQKSYERRGELERKALQKVRHVIGRTVWDKACVTQVNPTITYHENNESLRGAFYRNRWEYEKCDPYRIFMSQGGSPIKGVHLALEAMELLKNKYPLMHLYVTGRDVLGHLSIKKSLSMNPYDWYIRREIKKRGLEGKVIFLGTLNAEQMCEQYLKANAFILPSSIENSPNSLGEAMLLGTPCVAADVGGVSSLAADKVYLYPYDESYMLADCLAQIFEKGKKIVGQTERARLRALKTHDPNKNMMDLLNIYSEICVNGYKFEKNK